MIILSKWRQVKRFRKLPAPEKRVVMAAATLLLCSTLGLRCLGFKRWRDELNRWTRRPQWGYIAENETLTIGRTLYLMQLAQRGSPHHGNCLSQSLTLWSLLKRQGIESDLRIGVRHMDGQFEAHAWIERDGQPLNDVSDVQDRFAAFSKSMQVNITPFLNFEERSK